MVTVINLNDKRRYPGDASKAAPQLDDDKARRGGRYRAVVVSLGCFAWLAMAFTLGAWST